MKATQVRDIPDHKDSVMQDTRYDVNVSDPSKRYTRPQGLCDARYEI